MLCTDALAGLGTEAKMGTGNSTKTRRRRFQVIQTPCQRAHGQKKPRRDPLLQEFVTTLTLALDICFHRTAYILCSDAHLVAGQTAARRAVGMLLCADIDFSAPQVGAPACIVLDLCRTATAARSIDPYCAVGRPFACAPAWLVARGRQGR